MDQLRFGERKQLHRIYGYNVSVIGDVDNIRFEGDENSVRGACIHRKRGISAI